ncbi:flagellar hook-basal body complex protein (plasmid) [Paracoccus sp. TK19116]|uniref:Flagellar hook protein FlgE n=1 Tax=Paracoccus albicereus TaxID=2922394 RepID=A0ABT1MLH3_9RHOB|nr:flagellar hook-basal body complex protein [Paracoccus albicereus]MCQ0969148.1 flagellar hook-basal body complex protein [Paracoccus albicereus]
MSMSTALSAGVSGLTANATKLASISDNIANSGTYGYKRVETGFDAMVLNQVRTAGIYSAGGVRTSTARIIEQQGGLATTSHPLDLAIAGRGMLPVTSAVDFNNGRTDLPLMMTRTGAFRADAAGVLRTDSGLVLLGWPAQSDGSIPIMPRDAMGGLEPVQISVNQTAGDPTRNINLGVNLPATETAVGASGAPLDLKIEYYGNIGTSDSLDVTFLPQPSTTAGMSNTWIMQVRDSAMDPASNLVAEVEIVFDDSASLGGSIASVTPLGAGAYDAATGLLTFNVQGGPMSVDMGRPGAQTGLRQLASSFSPTNITKDGSPVGNLSSIEVDENGMVRATYDTGFIKTLYQIPLIDVPNPNGLISLDNQAFQVSPTSGSFFLWDAGDGPTGSVVGYAREESTTDVASELTDLIVTQRAYSSNAKVIQTVDEMLQETTNIKR